MTVKELRKLLKTFGPDNNVVVSFPEGEQNASPIEDITFAPEINAVVIYGKETPSW